MERTAVTSSNVASVGYEEDSQTLEIEFNNGSIYQYYDVPKHIFDALMQGGSIGSYLATNIKGQYRYSRI